MGFFKDWYEFIKTNAKRHMKRISIAVGSFLVLLVVSVPLGDPGFYIAMYAGFVETGSIIIMSLFGKNGNGGQEENEGP